LNQEEEFHQTGQVATSEIALQIGAARQTNNDQLQHYHLRSTKETAPQQPPAVTDALALPEPRSQSFSKIVHSIGLSSQVIDGQELAAAWLQPDAIVSVFYNRPHVNSILKLVGSWLFEAASSGSSPSREGMIVSERTLQVDPVSFHVGRAEAVACLCRIFIYAKKGQVSLEQLTRFYLCLIRALSLEPVCEFLLSTVLIHCPDLLRCDLRAAHVVVPYLFNACCWVFRKQSIVRPEYISMALLRRAALHQIISMVCLLPQLDGLTFSDISPHITSSADQLTAKKLRIQVAWLLLELLGQESDSQNLRMILSAAFTLLQTLSGQELPSEDESVTRSLRSSSSHDEASEFHSLLLEKICSNLVERWRNDLTVSSFALEVLSGMSQSCVARPHPDGSIALSPPHLNPVSRQSQEDRRWERAQVAGAAGAAPGCTTTPDSDPTEWEPPSEPVSCLMWEDWRTNAWSTNKQQRPPPPPLPPRIHPAHGPARSHAYPRKRNLVGCQHIERILSTHQQSSHERDYQYQQHNPRRLSILIVTHIHITHWSGKNCVRSICQFIASQCKREKKDHTRSVHSVIIHAYQCLASWLVAHASVMLSDPTILWSVIETTKLCIFGVASQATTVGGASGNSHTPDQAFPAPSKRVSEAAEQLLSILLSSVGNFPTPSGLDSNNARLTERHLVEMLTRREPQGNSRRQAPTSHHRHFRYFWDNASLMMGLLEEPTTTPVRTNNFVTNRSGAVPQLFVDLPSVLVVLRGDTFGPQVWSCKPRFLPRTPPPVVTSAAVVSHEDSQMQPPVSFLESVYAVDAPVQRFSTKPMESRFLPHSKQNIPLVQADKVMPSLEVICPAGSKARSEVDLLKSFITREVERDAETHRKAKERRCKNIIVYMCEPQKSVTIPDTTSKQTSQVVPNPNSCGPAIRVPDLLCDLTPIPSETPNFRNRLDTFDSAILRTTSTLLVFYVRKGQTTLTSVIGNMQASWSHFPKQFGSFVRSLGWPVDSSTHCGWAANVASKPRSNNGRISSFDYTYSGNAKHVYPPDGSDYLMYWADVAVEFAAICPSNRTEFRSVQGPAINEAQSENSEAPGKVALLWLELWDDALWSTGDRNPLQLAISEQFACTDLILVHPLQNGLLRIGIVRSAFEAGPLFTGLVTSPHCLGNLVRSTVVNIARRRQLASDSFQPLQIRRLSRFKEIACNVMAAPDEISVVTPVKPSPVRANHTVSTVELIRWSTE
uniref:Rap-GAP domain-containing protein n=1 Tax=Schistocephalus solidus TaxID=70667 RepID=A0A183SW74_SCHSO